MAESWIREVDGGVILRLRVKPRASRDRIEGPTPEGFLAVRLTAPPVDHQANAALLALLAKTLRVPKSAFSIVSGEKARAKTIRIEGVTKSEVLKALELKSG